MKMDPSRGDSRYNLNYSMSSIGLTLADQGDLYGNPAGALGARSPSSGILQAMSSVGSGALIPRSAGNIMSNSQCQSLVHTSSSQQRGLKRAGPDCYNDSTHRVGAASITSLQGLDNCGGSSNIQHNNQQQQSQSSSGNIQDIVDESYNNLQSKKSPPPNGKKTKGRVKIKMEYIDNKLRRYTTFSKRKTGIMKKAYELSTLTGTQVMLLVASETGHVYTFATRKLQPMITSEAGKQLIQTCLNSPDPPSVGSGDQRMSATGFEETELSYNIADEDSKELRSPISSINDSDESSECDGIGNFNHNNSVNSAVKDCTPEIDSNTIKNNEKKLQPIVQPFVLEAKRNCKSGDKEIFTNKIDLCLSESRLYTSSNLANTPQNGLLKLIEGGHIEVHTEKDGSGQQYVSIPLPQSALNIVESISSNSNDKNDKIHHRFS